jgi:sister-chromatid-cohesion protein PDS5
VRYKLLLKLGEILPSQRLMPRWNMLPVLVANDPEAEHVQLVSLAWLPRWEGADVQGASVMSQVVRSATSMPTGELRRGYQREKLQLTPCRAAYRPDRDAALALAVEHFASFRSRRDCRVDQELRSVCREAMTCWIKLIYRYIEMFLDCVATRDNISLLLLVAAKVKTVRDPTRDDNSVSRLL